MNLLLLLSALLSALTGVGASARAPGATPSVAASSIAARVAPARRVAVTVRPVGALPTLAAMATETICTVGFIIASAPLWASRRRE